MSTQQPDDIRVSAPPPDEIYQPPLANPEPAAAQSFQSRQVRDTRWSRAQTKAEAAQPDFRFLATPEDEVYKPSVLDDSPVADAPSRTQSAAHPAIAITALHGLKSVDYDDVIGSAPQPEGPTENLTPAALLDVQEIYHIIRIVAAADSGDAPYSFVSTDAEYTTPGQAAYQTRHFGVSVGLVRAAQSTGQLGALLNIMQRRDADQFVEIFGAQSQMLLRVTNANSPDARLADVEGQPLWSASWVDRFRRAGEVQTFQAAQNEHAIEGLFRPMLPMAYPLGFITDRALAMVFDRVIVQGLGCGLRWVVNAASVLATTAQRTAALATLGISRLNEFQQRSGWITADGQFGIETHAALVGALRESGKVPLPSTRELTTRLIDRADGAALDRLIRLRDHDGFDDIVYRQE